jgi:hypothetical protein
MPSVTIRQKYCGFMTRTPGKKVSDSAGKPNLVAVDPPDEQCRRARANESCCGK